MTDSVVNDSGFNEPFIEIDRGDTVWRFEREFLTSNWTCLFGNGCKGILQEDATELNQGCCSLGAHFGDGPAGQNEAMQVQAYAAMLSPANFQFFDDRTRPREHPAAHSAFTVTTNAPTLALSTVRASFLIGLASTAARAAPCISLRSSPTSRLPNGSLQSAGSFRCASTGKRSMPILRQRPCGVGVVLTGVSTVKQWLGAALSGLRAVRRTAAPSKSSTPCSEELTALAGDEVYVELKRRLTS